MVAASGAPYTTRGLPPPPDVSIKTIPMAGLLVDVYGLDELSAVSSSAPISCLWLLHPRKRTRARMGDIAKRTVHAYNEHLKQQSDKPAQSRGLIALAFDMPNHGTRLVSDQANLAWDQGNETHAIDMLGMVKGSRADMSGLMDVVSGYVGREVEGHVVLGWSLGGHAAWQAWIGEPRIDAAVAVVGCPDFMALMGDRASQTNLDCGENFLGSKYFPNSLVGTCCSHDPKACLFSSQPLPNTPLSQEEQARVVELLASRGLFGPNGKPLLLLSGKEDPLVPHKHTLPFVKVLESLEGVHVDDRVYEGVGHWFSADMVKDAVEFLVKAVADGPRATKAKM